MSVLHSALASKSYKDKKKITGIHNNENLGEKNKTTKNNDKKILIGRKSERKKDVSAH